MSITTIIEDLATGIIEIALPTSHSQSPVGNVTDTIAQNAITVSDLTKGLTDLSKIQWSNVQLILTSHFTNIQADAVTAEQIAQVLADAGVPYANDAELAIKVAAFVYGAYKPNMSGLNPTQDNTAENHWPDSRGR